MIAGASRAVSLGRRTKEIKYRDAVPSVPANMGYNNICLKN